MKLTAPIPDWMMRWLDNPGGEVTRWQRAARYSIDLCWHCAKALRHDNATEMAAALTYRTIFSLVPIVVLSLVVFSQFADFQKISSIVQDKTLDALGLNALSYEGAEPATPPSPEGEPAPIPQEPVVAKTEHEQRAQANLIVNSINQAIANTQQLNFKSIGIVGIALLIWGALGLVIALEDSFNQVFAAPQGRPWTRRIVVYWAALTLGPVLMAISIYLASSFTKYVEGWNVLWISTAIIFLSKHFALTFLSWALLVFLYMMMPNARVNLRPAAIGALVAAVLWEFGKYGFNLYVKTALPYSAIYGTLGLIPLFLFWVYLTWLTILFGLELTYTLQHMRGRRFKHDEHKQEEHIIDPAWVIPLAARIGSAFHAGKPVREEELGLDLNLPPRAVGQLVGALERAGLVQRVMKGKDTEGYSLARPADKIQLNDLLRAGRSLLPEPATSNNGDPAWGALKELQGAGQQEFGSRTLADLCKG